MMAPERPPAFGQGRQNQRVAALARLVAGGDYAAIAREARALSLQLPRHPFVLKALSFGLIGLGDCDQALPVVERALAVAPQDPELHNNHGIALVAALRADEALAAFDRALALDPADHVAWKNRGAACMEVRRLDDAIACLVKSIELNPEDDDEAIDKLSQALLDAGRTEEAKACLLALTGDGGGTPEQQARLLWAMANLCDWSGQAVAIEALRRSSQDFSVRGTVPFYALSLPGVDAAAQRRIAEAHARATLGSMFPAPLATPPSALGGRRLRIGYLSHDFREHPVGHVLPRVLELHDRERFEIVAYSTGPDDGSAIRRRLAAGCERFVDLAGLGISSSARRIAEDRPDILVDLQGWTSGEHSRVLALRPAATQIAWLGYAGTLGSARLADFVIGDALVTPEACDAWFTERVLRLPGCYLPMDPTQAVGPAPTRAAAGLPESGFVFCSFNASFKFNPPVFDAWCRLLRELPGSWLWLGGVGAAVADNLRREAALREVAPDRLIFAPRVEARADHLGRLQLADLALDPSPYNSHSSGMDTLWAGVPMVTLLGDSFAGRVGASLVTAAGLPECVTHDWDAYVELALALARDPDRLAGLRRRLAAGRDSAPLFDMVGFTRALEGLYAGLAGAAAAA